MMSVFWFGFWLGLTALAFAAGVSLRARIKERIWQPVPVVDDDAVEEILTTGILSTEDDEPLDLEDIDEEERRFWSETWDEPEEW